MQVYQKLFLIAGISSLTVYFIYTASNQQYDVAITNYNNAFTTALTIFNGPRPIPAHQINTFIDQVKNARSRFQRLEVYWEHDKRTLASRRRAAERIMDLATIPNIIRSNNAPELLKQHETKLREMEALAENLGETRGIRQLNRLKNIVLASGQTISTKLGLAERNLNQGNIGQASNLLSEVKALVDQLLDTVDNI